MKPISIAFDTSGYIGRNTFNGEAEGSVDSQMHILYDNGDIYYQYEDDGEWKWEKMEDLPHQVKTDGE